MSKKSMLKRVSAFCLMGAVVFGLAACGEKADTAVSTKNSPAVGETSGKSIGEFETTTLEKKQITQDVLKENDLTMVNVFSSTCNPCMGELPHLAELSNEYKDKKVGILAVNIDTDSSGNPDENSRNAVLQVLGKSESNMKVIFWDKNLMNMLSEKTLALPYTFFVDKNGNIVGNEYFGSRSKEDWIEVIDKEFAGIASEK